MKKTVLALLVLAAGYRPGWSAPPLSKPAQVLASTATASAPSVLSLYPVEDMRDPFSPPASSAYPGAAGKPFSLADFNIHNLALLGLMADRHSGYAVFTDMNSGASFVLKKGILYGPRGKPIPGVSGSMNFTRRSVDLVMRDGDVQVFKMGGGEKP